MYGICDINKGFWVFLLLFFFNRQGDSVLDLTNISPTFSIKTHQALPVLSHDLRGYHVTRETPLFIKRDLLALVLCCFRTQLGDIHLEASSTVNLSDFVRTYCCWEMGSDKVLRTTMSYTNDRNEGEKQIKWAACLLWYVSLLAFYLRKKNSKRN